MAMFNLREVEGKEGTVLMIRRKIGCEFMLMVVFLLEGRIKKDLNKDNLKKRKGSNDGNAEMKKKRNKDEK